MNNNEEKPTLSHVVEKLTEARAYINDALADTPYSAIQIRTNHQLTSLINMISALTGNTGINRIEPQEFEAANNFMGEDVTVKTVVTPEILSVDQEMIAKIKARVTDLEEMIVWENTETILKNFVTNEDMIVIRALGKKCDIPNYSDAVINSEFVQAIKEVLEKNADIAKAKAPSDNVANLEVKKTDQEALLKSKQDELTKVQNDIENSKAIYEDLKLKKAKAIDIKAAIDGVDILIEQQEKLNAEIGILGDQLAETNSSLIKVLNAEGSNQ